MNGKGHRFDFGGVPGEKYLVTSIVFEVPGYKKYTLDLTRCEEWIKYANQLRKPMVLNGAVLFETAGNDAFIVTQDGLLEKFCNAEVYIPGKNIALLITAELLLLAFLAAYPWIVQGIFWLFGKIRTSKFAAQAAVFAAVNLLVIVPAVYYACRNIPDEFVITLKSPKFSAIQLYHKKPYSEKNCIILKYTDTNKFQTLKAELPPETVRQDIRIDFGYVPSEFEVSSICINKYGLWKKYLDLEDIPNVYSANSHVSRFEYKDGKLLLTTVKNDPHIVPDPVKYVEAERCSLQGSRAVYLILFSEILLIILLSGKIKALIRKISVQLSSRKENLILSASVAGAFAFIMFLSFPLQTFKVGEEIILFKIYDLIKVLCWLVPSVFVSTAVILYLLNKRYGAVFSIFLGALTTMFVIENSFLSFALPELDGSFDAYHNVPRMILHAVIWLCVCIVPLFFQRRICKWMPLVVLAASLMNAAALIDTLLKPPAESGKDALIVPADRLMPIDETLEYVRLSDKDNVIMICLDGVSSEVVHEVFKKYPDLKEHFTGFISFSNNIGMSHATMYTVPGFFTGEYVTHETVAYYPRTIYQPKSIVKDFMQKNYAIFNRVGLTRLSYVDADGEMNSRKYDVNSTFDDSIYPWKFNEFYMFKVSPFFLKGAIVKHLFYNVWSARKNAERKNSALPHLRKDDVTYNFIANAPLVSDKYNGTFQYHHFHGGHQPFNFDENGNEVDRSHIPWDKDWEGYLSRVTLEIKRVAAYLDRLKQRGLYDKSTIIVLADHGVETHKAESKVSTRLKPFLMVKTLKAEAPFAEVTVPSSTSKVASFLRGDLADMSSGKVIKHFTTSNRCFISPAYGGELVKWNISDDGADYTKEILTSSEKRKLAPVILNYSYSLNREDLQNVIPDLDYKMFAFSGQGVYINHGQVALMRFAVKNRDKSYTVKINANCMRDFDGLSGSEYAFDIYTPDKKSSTVFEGSGIIELSHVKPDENGEITICFKRRKEPQQNYFFFVVGLQVVQE